MLCSFPKILRRREPKTPGPAREKRFGVSPSQVGAEDNGREGLPFFFIIEQSNPNRCLPSDLNTPSRIPWPS